MGEILRVGMGGLLGAIARFTVSRWLTDWFSLPHYAVTVVINCVGSLILGVLVARSYASNQPIQRHFFLAVGFCGSFTTFSTWVFDISSLARQASIPSAGGHAVLSMALGLIAFGGGLVLGRITG